jgi:hypothetical protein
VQDSVLMGSEEFGHDVSNTVGCAGSKPGGVAARRCQGCTGPGMLGSHGLTARL